MSGEAIERVAKFSADIFTVFTAALLLLAVLALVFYPGYVVSVTTVLWLAFSSFAIAIQNQLAVNDRPKAPGQVWYLASLFSIVVFFASLLDLVVDLSYEVNAVLLAQLSILIAAFGVLVWLRDRSSG